VTEKQSSIYRTFEANQFFTALPYMCGVLDDMLAMCTPDGWGEYYNFKAKEVPKSLIENEKAFQGIRHPFKAGILRMDPYTVYNWHTDDKRKMSINMLLSHGHSHCLFTTKQGVNIPVTELPYEIGRYYILNTKMPHMVINLEKPRYMFSVEFLDD